MDLLLFPDDPGVLGRAAQAVLLVGEEHAADGVLRHVAHGLEDAEDVHGFDAARAVVMRAGGDIPGVEVAAHGDDLLGMLGALQLAQHVERWGVLEPGGVDADLDLQRRVILEGGAELFGCKHAQGGGRDARYVRQVGGGPGVGDVVVRERERAGKNADGAILGGGGRAAVAGVAGLAVRTSGADVGWIHGPVEEDDPALHVGGLELVERVQLDDRGTQAVGRGGDGSPEGECGERDDLAFDTRGRQERDAFLRATFPVRYHHGLQFGAVGPLSGEEVAGPFGGTIELGRTGETAGKFLAQLAQLVVRRAADESGLIDPLEHQLIGARGRGDGAFLGRAAQRLVR